MVIEKIIFLLLIQNTDLVTAELFTSNAHLETTLYLEREIGNILQDYVTQEEIRLEKIKKLAGDYKKHSTSATENIEQFLGNPVNAYLLIKKLTSDWVRDVEPIISNSSWTAVNESINQLRTFMPSGEDLQGAAVGLMRLQDTYRLNASAIARGDLGGTKSPILSALECFELGLLSYSRDDFYHTKLWMEQTLADIGSSAREQDEAAVDVDSIEEDVSKTKVNRSLVLDYLAYSLFELGEIQPALELTIELLRIDPNHERAVHNKLYFETMMKDESAMKLISEIVAKPAVLRIRDNYRISEEFLTYEALCRGEDTKPLNGTNKLTCRYLSNNHPLLLLHPAKEETMHLDPFIAIYHDVLSDTEITQIKQLAMPRLNRALVHNVNGSLLQAAQYRISKSAWIPVEVHEVIQRIDNIITAITGLDMTTSENIQIANYGVGGQYEPHFDFYRKEEEHVMKEFGAGNRIATFLAYMSDVDAGGATVFPYLGLKLYPKKGSAAFWYNLFKNGEGNYNTNHAACPVLVGTKWVANKWIHETGQEFRRPCGLDAEE